MMAMSDARDEDRPVSLKTKALGFVSGVVMLAGLSAALGLIGAVLFDPDIRHPVNWQTWAFLALFVAIGAAGLWGLLRLRPWAQGGPLSQSTRRANALFGLAALVCMPGAIALALTSSGPDKPFGFFSSSPVALWVALLAIASWLLSMWLSWKWYFSADEHEREAYDFASVVGAGIFTALAPVWWIAARAGLVPQPDAMVLWLITMIAISVGWIWRRSR